MKPNLARAVPLLFAAVLLAGCGGGSSGGGGDNGGIQPPGTPPATGDAGSNELYIGYYAEDRTDNPEDPTLGAVYLNLPEGDSSFSGNMFFTYVGCQTSNVGGVNGTKTAGSLAADWSGTIDNEPQNGNFNGTYDAAGGSWSGTYTVADGKQFLDLFPCIRYWIASRGSWELFAVGTNTPAGFAIDIDLDDESIVSFAMPPGAAGALVSVLDATLAATPGSGNAIVWQGLIEPDAPSPVDTELPIEKLSAGSEYIAAVAVAAADGSTLAFGSKRFIAR